MSIAMHTALNELERERRNRSLSVEESEYDEHRELLLQRIEQAIGELGEPDGRIVRMYYYEERKTDDIARQTGLSQSNVLVRLHRVRERLRKQLSNNNE
ncbi:MAG: sigma-70 family RNA polymerase sigma factor [Prevotella sp.]|nr:sigma-70 family RNA polymerase sigma factor [Prevotella sp.]